MTTRNPQAKKPDFFESAPTEKSGFFDPGTPPTREPKSRTSPMIALARKSGFLVPDGRTMRM
jgi:hypothetical protein